MGQGRAVGGPGGGEDGPEGHPRGKKRVLGEFLSRVEGEDVWAVTQYTGPQRSAAVPTIRHQGEVAEGHSDKSRMLMDISFPSPVPYAGDDGVRGTPGRAHLAGYEHLVERAFQQEEPRPGWDGTPGHSMSL